MLSDDVESHPRKSGRVSTGFGLGSGLNAAASASSAVVVNRGVPMSKKKLNELLEYVKSEDQASFQVQMDQDNTFEFVQHLVRVACNWPLIADAATACAVATARATHQ